MAIFTLVSAKAEKTDKTTIQANAGNFSIRTSGVKATARVKAKLVQNERFYLGFIQTCIQNSQVCNYFGLGNAAANGPVPFEPVVIGSPAPQKAKDEWLLAPLPCSDSNSGGTRPWYGTASSIDVRRISLFAVGEKTHELSMTDWFAPTPPATQTNVSDNKTYHLAQWTRRQKFATWLAVVFESQEKRGAQAYLPLWRFDWEYDGVIDQTWNTRTTPALGTVTRDTLTISNEQKQQGAVTMTKNLQHTVNIQGAAGVAAVSSEAFTTSIANDLQRLTTTYVNR